jgi:hypothetical protein
MDGHRRNILMAQHVRVGIGLAKTAGSSVEMPATCLVQEFVDPYGTYEKLPSHIKVGDKLTVRGVVKAPATVIGVGLARIPLPKALPVSEANARRSYPVPAPYVTYWPEGYQTPLPLETDGHKFAITVPVSDGGKAGLYEVSVWAKLPGSKDNKMVSLRTLRVEP